MENAHNDDQPVTTVITRRIRAGREGDFETWFRGISREAHAYPGHLGVGLIKLPNREYVSVFRFDSYAHMRAWEQSEVRRKWMAWGRGFVEGEPRQHYVTGVEYWFKLPGDALEAPPPVWKMSVVTWLAITPLAFFIPGALLPVLNDPLTPFGASALVSAVITLLMSYAVMPLAIRLFKRWLYPR